MPQRLAHPYPVVMIHGGSQTGTNFTGTPDGREGWAQYFLRRGYAVYVVDQVARGRAAHWSRGLRAGAAPPAELRGAALRRARAHQAVAAGASAQPMAGRRQARATRPSTSSMPASFPRWSTFPCSRSSIATPRGAARPDRARRCCSPIRSPARSSGRSPTSGPSLVKAIVAVEPNGPPAHDVEFKGAPDWFTDAAAHQGLGPDATFRSPTSRR